MHATLKKFWRLVVGLWPAAITLGVVWLAFMVVGNPLGKPATLGRIIVDTPEIYTRERLVNDRLIHEAWLLEQLKKTSEVQGSLSSRTDSRTLDLQAAEGAEQIILETGVRNTAALGLFVRSADWCPFCRQQLADANEHVARFGEHGVAIVSVSVDEVDEVAPARERDRAATAQQRALHHRCVCHVAVRAAGTDTVRIAAR